MVRRWDWAKWGRTMLSAFDSRNLKEVL